MKEIKMVINEIFSKTNLSHTFLWKISFENFKTHIIICYIIYFQAEKKDRKLSNSFYKASISLMPKLDS